MSPLWGKDEREAAREAKESRRQQQEQALDEFINRAARAADAGDVSSEEQAIAAGWKWVNASDGVLGSLTKQWTQRIERAMTTSASVAVSISGS